MEKQQGIIQLIIILVLFIVILSLLGVSLSAVFQNKTLRGNFAFVWNAIEFVWQHWLKGPAEIVWSFIAEFFWGPFLDAMRTIKRGENPFAL